MEESRVELVENNLILSKSIILYSTPPSPSSKWTVSTILKTHLLHEPRTDEFFIIIYFERKD